MSSPTNPRQTHQGACESKQGTKLSFLQGMAPLRIGAWDPTLSGTSAGSALRVNSCLSLQLTPLTPLLCLCVRFG